MKFIKINPLDFPIEENESWWPIHPNNANCEFRAPIGAIAACLKSFLDFKVGVVYTVVSNDDDHGWISLLNTEGVVEMPYYLFARHFDAEAFIKHISMKKINSPIDLETHNG